MICLLRIIQGPAAGQKCWLRNDQNVSIGRLSTSEFPIPLDMHLSRRHMMLEGRGTSFRIRDVGSSNGTFVNGVRITVAELCHQDLIRAGESVFEVTLHTDRPAEDLEFDDPVSSPVASSDSSPTACFTGSLMDELPVRSVNARPRASGNSEASLSAGQDTPQKDNPAEPSVHGEIAVAGKSASELRLARESSLAGARDFLAELANSGLQFLGGGTEGLYQMEWNAESGDKSALGVFQEAAKRFHCFLVLNQSQVSTRQVAVLDLLANSGTARRISQTLMIVPLDPSGSSAGLVKSCLKQDALILVGSLQSRADQWLDSIADVLSYPSMLDGLLKQPNSRLARKLADYGDCFLFESASPRAIKLLLPGLAEKSE